MISPAEFLRLAATAVHENSIDRRMLIHRRDGLLKCGHTICGWGCQTRWGCRKRLGLPQAVGAPAGLNCNERRPRFFVSVAAVSR